ncbi:MAG: hypothetical protein L0K86_03760, partial [Actinomycetia bacterium]|nr:hypothetical protein [Actinomycetes bacterium]
MPTHGESRAYARRVSLGHRRDQRQNGSPGLTASPGACMNRRPSRRLGELVVLAGRQDAVAAVQGQ